MDIDQRKLNLIRLAILKESKDAQILPAETFMRICLGILRIDNFESSEAMEAIKECICEENEDVNF